MFALTNGVFYTGKSVINDRSLLIDGKNIVGFIKNDEIGNVVDVVDLGGSVVSPGFIDIQINGCCGKLFSSDTSIDVLRKSSSIFAEYGTTRWMPTYLSMSGDEILKLTTTIRELTTISGVLGVHIEGPWIDEEFKGVHPTKNIRKWSSTDFCHIKKMSDDLLVCVTLSPGKISTDELKVLCELKRVKVLLGHSKSTYEDAIIAFNNGVSGVTHILNAMEQPKSRNPSVIPAVMDNSKICASIIVDMLHIHPVMVKLLKRSFHKSSLFFISDAMPIIGGTTKTFAIGNNKCTYQNGHILDENNNFAGSSIMVIDGVKNSVQIVGIPMDEALRMATLYPAKFLGIENEFGLIESGYKADLTVFTNQFKILKTYRSGELEYDRTQ